MNNLKPFDLEACLGGEEVVTRMGQPYQLGAHKPDAIDTYALLGWVNNEGVSHNTKGHYNWDGEEHPNDLFMVPTKVPLHIVVYRGDKRTGGRWMVDGPFEDEALIPKYSKPHQVIKITAHE